MASSLVLALLLIVGLSRAGANDPSTPPLQLTTTTQTFQSLISTPNVAWYKNDMLVFNGTEFQPLSGIEPANIVLQRSISQSSDGGEEGGGKRCVMEELTLLLKNLSKKETGEYRCQVQETNNQSTQQLDFRLDILESGLKAGFHENFTYDYTECCVERGLSPLCRAMCRPRTMHLDFFDPTSCGNVDYKGFLSCVTDNGRRDFTSCCRKKSQIPTFCYDFCSNKFEMLKRSHRLCLYYLPEIFQCFNRPEQQLSNPPQVPTGLRLMVREEGPRRNGGNKFCFKAATTPTTSTSYTIHVREIPMEGPSAAVLSNELQVMTLAATKMKKRMRRTAAFHVGKTSDTAMTPGEVFVVVHESSMTSPDAMFNKLDWRGVERTEGGEICVTWHDLRLRSSSRYVTYVQASNDYGASEPSAPLFINTVQ